jgi:hypothetical protein
MYNIIITDKKTKKVSVLDVVKTKEEAEAFCDAWGWFYIDEEGKKYYLDYEEIIISGKLYYNSYEPYVVFCIEEENNKPYTRKVLELNKNNKTCKIRFKNEIITIKFHY